MVNNEKTLGFLCVYMRVCVYVCVFVCEFVLLVQQTFDYLLVRLRIYRFDSAMEQQNFISFIKNKVGSLSIIICLCFGLIIFFGKAGRQNYIKQVFFGFVFNVLTQLMSSSALRNSVELCE